MDVKIKQANHLDIPAIREIEGDCFSESMPLDVWRKLIQADDILAVVASVERLTCGWLILQKPPDKSSAALFALGVAPVLWRQGIGKRLISFAKLQVKMSVRYKRIVYDCPECNLNGQLFLRACGFRCVRIVHDEVDGEFYRFQWEAA